MGVEVFTWRILNERPLIQAHPHKMWQPPPAEDTPKTRRAKQLRGTDDECFEIARNHLYLNEEGLYYHPAIAFWDVILMACEGRSFGKANALSAITQSVCLMDEEFILYQPDTLQSKQPQPMKGDEWQIDMRRAVNHNEKTTQGGVGVVAIRPKWKRWGGFLRLEVDMHRTQKKDGFDNPGTFESIDSVTMVLNIGGHLYGIGVGRQRIKAQVRNKPVWSGFGSGKFSATLVEGENGEC